MERCYLDSRSAILRCSPWRFFAIVPNHPSSVGVKSPPERLPRRAVRGLGAQSPHQTGSSHSREGFIRFTGFPKREEQYGELSGDSDDSSLLIPCCSLPGETQSVLAQRTIGPKMVPEYTARRLPEGVAGIGLRISKSVIPCQSLRFDLASDTSPGRLQCRAFAGSGRDSPL